ncbi:response regulator transcription factor [Pseudonocardia humida]|uniref:Response regulator transcription factor n=1 Tax=Pseudonocardia humida TaxID=2800819 RepID=A0ABT1A223_9PSEU|nr:response regulator transcription factor [Pseudonocardia humida]MCO1657054.1 response regulator transcription factor [Pseudonocardia humida]
MDTARAPDATGPPGPPLPVLLVDDHRVFTDALRISLDLQPGLRCAAVAHSARDGLARAGAVDVAAAVVDLVLPDADGLDVVAALRARRPAVRVIVLTAHPRPELAQRALAAGAVGFLGKDAPLERILAALRAADAEHPVVDVPPAAEAAVRLTHREHEVLRGLGAGLDATRIAGELGLSVHTTRGHIKAVLAKLGAQNQLGAVVTAQRLGLVTVGPRR